MGLFEFAKGAGAKIFGNSAEKAEEAARDENLGELRKSNELLRLVLSMKLPIEGLQIKFDDGVATVHGAAENTALKELVVLTVGNVEGVATVDDRMTVQDPTPAATMYTVKSGDSLSKIAKNHYGDAMKYPAIFEANKPMLTDPDKIYPGQVLRIPAM